MMLISFLLLLPILHLTAAILVSEFYDFGSAIDRRLPKNDDNTSETQLSSPFPFYGVNYTTLYVSF